MTTTTTPEALPSLLSRCGELKTRVVEFVRNNHRARIEALLHARSSPLTEWDVAGTIDEVVHGSADDTGQTTLDRFLQSASDLSEEDRAIIRGWNESFWGVFEVHGIADGCLQTTNLVDGLAYRLVATTNDPKMTDQFGRAGFVFTRIDRLRDIWMMSGLQSLIKPTERRVALGMASQLAIEEPSLLYRNPANLERARELDRQNHERFVSHFGVPWIVGTPQEVERTYEAFLQLHNSASDLFRLPADLRRARTVGVFSDPKEGPLLFPDAGVLMQAIENPSALQDTDVREVVLQYLEAPGASPAVLALFAQSRPAELNAMLAAVLDRPHFDWARDGEALVRERNPGFHKREVLPTTLPLSEELAEAARAWRERSRQVPQRRAASPKQKNKRKQAKAARRKNRP